MKKIALGIFWISALFSCANATAQVGIGTTTPQAALDVTSTNGGFLPPRVALTAVNDTSTVVNPQGGSLVTGTIVYNIGTAGLSTPGYYFWNGTSWTNLASTSVGNTAWLTSGNTALPAGSFIGTTDANDLVIKTNGVESLRITTAATGTSGDVIIGNNDSTNLGRLELLNSHIRSVQTNPPTITTPLTASFPVSPPAPLPTDMRGSILVKGSLANLETIASVQFYKPYLTNPVVMLSLGSAGPTNKQIAAYYYAVATTTGFDIHFFTSDDESGTTTLFNYFVID